MLTDTQTKYLKDSSRAMEAYGIADAIAQGEKVVAATYDFSVSGGATGDYEFSYTFEEDALVTKILAHEISAFTSGNAATITVKAGSTSLTGALAFDSAFTGFNNLTLASSAAAVAVTAGSTLLITVAAHALTAGKTRFYVYAVPQKDF